MKQKKNSFKIILTTILLASLCVVMTPPDAQGSNALRLIRDVEIETILQEWSAPIFEAAGLNPKAVNIILVQSDQVNAFVAGGSNIFIYTGLIEKTENPGELIGVIAHETGHIAGGHLIRAREAMERASYESIIGTIIGIGVAIASGDAGAAPALSVGGSTFAQRGFLSHSRIQESSADQAALTFLEQSKINPSGMKSFMKKLQSENYVPEEQQSEYIRTHPLVENRIEALKHRVSKSQYKGKEYPEKWQQQHARMRAKLMGFINPSQVSWAYDDKDVSTQAQYARAIAAYQENNIEEALKRINDLIGKEPKNPYFHELKGQMLLDFGRVQEAIPAYRKAMTILPEEALLRISLAHALMQNVHNAENESVLNESIKHLEHALRKEPRSSRVHRLLATAYGRLGQENKAKLHLAEEAVLQRRFDYARQHAQQIITQEKPESHLWIKAQDIISFIEIAEKG